MRLAVVGWADDSGVGRELTDAVRHLPVACAFILSSPAKPTRHDLLGKVPWHEPKTSDLRGEMKRFLDEHRPDTVLTWEVPGSWDFPQMWFRAGIKWVCVIHHEWFAPVHLPEWRLAWKLVAPNDTCWKMLTDEFCLDSQLIQVPIDTDQFPFSKRTHANRFVTVYGRGGPQNRRSLPEILSAWSIMEDPPQLVIKAQVVPSELRNCPFPYNVRLDLGNAPESSQLYKDADVAVQPSAYEGVGLSLLEAQACGLPVLTVAAPPMGDLAPSLIVPVEEEVKIDLMNHAIRGYKVSSEAIRTKVEWLKGRDIRALSLAARARIEALHSWSALKGRWTRMLEA